MSNLGFMHAMKDAGITVVTTPVGDRYVLENMIANDYSLGGEQSGHVIMRDLANTGDGILTALAVLQEVVRTGKTLQELAATMVRFPQVLINVKDVAKGYDCGMQIKNYNDIEQLDIIEAFQEVEVKKKMK
jgi:phosphoglucosamine mutase